MPSLDHDNMNIMKWADYIPNFIIRQNTLVFVKVWLPRHRVAGQP